MKTRILLVEDDERLADLSAEYLRKNDFEVSIEVRGKDGSEVCRPVREKYKGVILMLPARDEDLDQILGLELGADDYLAKPVQPRLLLARIKALLRRAPGTASPADQAVEPGDASEL